MYSNIYLPRFFSTSLEIDIQRKLSDRETLNWDQTRYQALLNLKKHLSRMMTSLAQLKQITGAAQIESMCSLIELSMQKAISDPSFNSVQFSNALNNKFSQLKDEIEEYKKLQKCFSGCNLFANSIVASVGALGVVLFGAAAATGPLGIALLGLGMAILSALVFAAAAYSVYVDARFLGDKQLENLETGINFLNNYPNVSFLLDEHPTGSTLCCI
ncbi:hypothetical protein DGG96_04725 [Legionella qingyii]|uniref:Uncharacterized protein n=1 Tax=Legionella qingyii TaxID=2184757 RepID=A0A317U635_9GAMM|nr:hypothetical protein [Legionella qingyii]PWY56715.1 hypothetical protein DGG96_04725 [Legionella qingyii]RUR23730.1 hypothetical protein ELY20_06890 [Legionella qingyii]RUR26312.1 hypothetical protein ELY16_07750 [Legionella qingyii]